MCGVAGWKPWGADGRRRFVVVVVVVVVRPGWVAWGRGTPRGMWIQRILGPPPPPLFQSTAAARVKLAFESLLCLSITGALIIKLMLGTCVHATSKVKVGSLC